LIPFLSTAGASLTIIALQSIRKIDIERKKKLYAVSYMTDVCVRLLQASLIIKNNTITPHITAAKQIMAGDNELLKKMFLADEFDVLTDEPVKFTNIPEEYKVLIGYDSIKFLQSFEMVLYLYRLEKIKNSFNEFVKVNLKSELAYHQKSPDEQIEILSRYWDYLDKLSHEEDRVIAFILYIFLQHAQEYINRFAFLLYSKKDINQLFSKAQELSEQYGSIIPDTDFFQQSVSGGIQKIIKDDI
ncbi:hypothetical protein KKA14_06120, partial [bacterium]|nr:hypothetical protein [bacterium]